MSDNPSLLNTFVTKRTIRRAISLAADAALHLSMSAEAQLARHRIRYILDVYPNTPEADRPILARQLGEALAYGAVLEPKLTKRLRTIIAVIKQTQQFPVGGSAHRRRTFARLTDVDVAYLSVSAGISAPFLLRLQIPEIMFLNGPAAFSSATEVLLRRSVGFFDFCSGAECDSRMVASSLAPRWDPLSFVALEGHPMIRLLKRFIEEELQGKKEDKS